MIKGLDITIKRSDRKTLSIYVERDGGISVLAPERMADKELKEVLAKKEYLIQKHHAQHTPTHIPRNHGVPNPTTHDPRRTLDSHQEKRVEHLREGGRITEGQHPQKTTKSGGY